MTQRHPFTFTVYDGIAFGAAALGLPFALVATWMGKKFEAMFADFGAALPNLTRLCLTLWFPLLLAALPLAVALIGLLLQPTRGGRIAVMSVAVFLAVLAPVIWVVGMYLPIFELAGKIK